jgi:hypothetical protein
MATISSSEMFAIPSGDLKRVLYSMTDATKPVHGSRHVVDYHALRTSTSSDGLHPAAARARPRPGAQPRKLDKRRARPRQLPPIDGGGGRPFASERTTTPLRLDVAPAGDGGAPERALAAHHHAALEDGPAPLPEGWAAHADPQTGGTFYHCGATNTTQWAHPAALAHAAAAAGLPDGWGGVVVRRAVSYVVSWRRTASYRAVPRRAAPCRAVPCRVARVEPRTADGDGCFSWW